MVKRLNSKYTLWLGAVLLVAAPLWAPHFQELQGHNLFLCADAMVLLGLSLFAGLLCQQFLSDRIISMTESLVSVMSKKIVLLSCVFLPLLLFGFMAINEFILHSFMNSADEHSCFFLAECFRMGKWWVEPHALSEFFDVVHVGNRDGKWFSVYPFGWPLLMALGLQWNMVDWFNPIMTTFSLVFFFLAGRKIFGTAAAWIGLALMAITPFFMFTGASYFFT